MRCAQIISCRSPSSQTDSFSVINSASLQVHSVFSPPPLSPTSLHRPNSNSCPLMPINRLRRCTILYCTTLSLFLFTSCYLCYIYICITCYFSQIYCVVILVIVILYILSLVLALKGQTGLYPMVSIKNQSINQSISLSGPCVATSTCTPLCRRSTPGVSVAPSPRSRRSCRALP